MSVDIESQIPLHHPVKYNLKIFISYDDDDYLELKYAYNKQILKHNTSILKSHYPDSGFDIFVPKKTKINKNGVTKINMKIVGAMFHKKTDAFQNVNYIPIGYTMYPRSSISKTNLRMSNSTGIIDSGYRGDLIGAFDYYPTTVKDELWSEGYIEQYHRLLQICHPTLEPFTVQLVDNLSDLGNTERGTGGFGSTGK